MRNKNIDVTRTIALLLVLIYHIWALTGSTSHNIPFISTMVSLGGELGVTIFFIISGFGIYNAIKKQESSEAIKFFPFIKKRFVRIMPEYYSIIFLVLLLTPGAAYLSKAGLKDIILHLIFLHNITEATAGSINGVLWTMALIVQFYIISIPMYKLLKKIKYAFPIIAILVTIAFKYVVFHHLGFDDSFWASRETIFSCLDNFALGMFVAYLLEKGFMTSKFNKTWINCILIVLGIFCLYLACEAGLKFGIHDDNFSGYIWHSVIAIICSLIILVYARKDLFGDWFLKKAFIWISKYEYSIYILHMLMIQYLFGYSSFAQFAVAKGMGIKYIFFTVICIASGFIFHNMADGFRNILNKK